MFEAKVGNTRYTAEIDDGPGMPKFVRFVRYNRQTTELHIPVSLVWKLVEGPIRDRLRANVYRLVDKLLQEP